MNICICVIYAVCSPICKSHLPAQGKQVTKLFGITLIWHPNTCCKNHEEAKEVDMPLKRLSCKRQQLTGALLNLTRIKEV